MGYSNQCNFMKVAGDDGNPVNAPDIIDIDPNTCPPNNFSPSQQPTSLPTRDRGQPSYLSSSHHNGNILHPTFSSYATAPQDVDTGSTNDLSGTSPDMNSRTPNSSTTGTTSDAHHHQHQHHQRQNLSAPGTGHVGSGSGRNSFEASPVPAHQNLNGGPNAATGTAPTAGGPNDAYFNHPDHPTTYGLPDQHRFGMATNARDGSGVSSGGSVPGNSGGGGNPAAAAAAAAAAAWVDMSGQQGGMEPVADGVLRSIMVMGPIDGMEMGWEPS